MSGFQQFQIKFWVPRAFGVQKEEPVAVKLASDFMHARVLAAADEVIE
jgi:hypothetical protein